MRVCLYGNYKVPTLKYSLIWSMHGLTKLIFTASILLKCVCVVRHENMGQVVCLEFFREAEKKDESYQSPVDGAFISSLSFLAPLSALISSLSPIKNWSKIETGWTKEVF
eukprot:m.166645 g.166645  ORF g.166645 m.166645 type:complete len:110 (+) comp15289_c0_seq2:2079-2408(+)